MQNCSNCRPLAIDSIDVAWRVPPAAAREVSVGNDPALVAHCVHCPMVWLAHWLKVRIGSYAAIADGTLPV